MALEGETFNGHDFVAQAIEKGAIAAVVRKGALATSANLPSLPLIEVDDTLAAYQALGRWWRQQRAVPVVAITGICR